MAKKKLKIPKGKPGNAHMEMRERRAKAAAEKKRKDNQRKKDSLAVKAAIERVKSILPNSKKSKAKKAAKAKKKKEHQRKNSTRVRKSR